MAFFTRFILALLGIAFAVLFAVGVLFWLALYVVFACLRWLTTGQKPQVLLMWQQIQTMRKGMQSATGTSWSRTDDGQWHEEHSYTQHKETNSSVIEDVVVREVQDKRYLPRD